MSLPSFFPIFVVFVAALQRSELHKSISFHSELPMIRAKQSADLNLQLSCLEFPLVVLSHCLTKSSTSCCLS